MTPNPPHTYSEWVAIIQDFKSATHDSGILESMQKGRLEWQAHVAERFMIKFIDAIKYRQKTEIEKFKRNIAHISVMNEGLIVQALISLRKEFLYQEQAVNIQAIPEDYRTKLRQFILETSNSVQSSLEESATDTDHSGKLASIIRNNPVNIINGS